jgi:hypothetical protein
LFLIYIWRAWQAVMNVTQHGWFRWAPDCAR